MPEITAPAIRKESFEVPGWIHVAGGFISRHPRLMLRLGNFESRCLSDRLAAVRIDRPIFITGLARSGTTILLELVAAHRGIATHRYRDYPPILAPYAWNWWLGHVPLKEAAPVERTHADGIFVTSESPEAMEEVIWMTFFSALHDPARSNVLDAGVSNPEFESFYRDHIRKIILMRGARYASKENYNLTRIEYLAKLFPDARFVIPIRHPVGHIASLIKQHRMLGAGQRSAPRSLTHFQRVGHFEFGEDRRPINVGDASAVEEIQSLWRAGEEVRGWARYWATIYGFAGRLLDSHPALRDAALVVRFEDLCARPEHSLAQLAAHCGLDDPDFVGAHAERLRAPEYYSARFSEGELAVINDETAAVRTRFGYD